MINSGVRGGLEIPKVNADVINGLGIEAQRHPAHVVAQDLGDIHKAVMIEGNNPAKFGAALETKFNDFHATMASMAPVANSNGMKMAQPA